MKKVIITLLILGFIASVYAVGRPSWNQLWLENNSWGDKSVISSNFPMVEKANGEEVDGYELHWRGRNSSGSWETAQLTNFPNSSNATGAPNLLFVPCNYSNPAKYSRVYSKVRAYDLYPVRVGFPPFQRIVYIKNYGSYKYSDTFYEGNSYCK